jgi:hypothetical protein
MTAHRITRLTAATLLGLGAALAPMSFAAAAPAPAAPAPAAPAPAAPAPVITPENSATSVLDTRMTVKNGTQGYLSVCMAGGATCDVITQGVLLSPGETMIAQGWSSTHVNDVYAQIRISNDGLPYGPGRIVSVGAGNPVFGWPSMCVEGNERDELAAGDTVTRTSKGHTFELHRNVDLNNSKDMWVTVKN